MNNVVVAVDAGTEISGIIVMRNEKIWYADNIDNDEVMQVISKYNEIADSILVLIEDIKPYSLKMGQSVIDTIKYIGSLEYRLKTARIEFKLIGRNEVKRWIFERFNDICVGRIDEKIEYLSARREAKGEKGFKTATGEMRKASFIWVDDRVVIAAMKSYWSIPTPKPGKTNTYGISSHAWQALALFTCYKEKNYLKVGISSIQQ